MPWDYELSIHLFLLSYSHSSLFCFSFYITYCTPIEKRSIISRGLLCSDPNATLLDARTEDCLQTKRTNPL